VLADHALPEARPRSLVIDASGGLREGGDGLPPDVVDSVRRLRVSPPPEAEADPEGRVVVPMTVDGHSVGGVVGWAGLTAGPDSLDLAVVRILANQAAVAFHTAHLYASSVALQGRAQHLSQAASQHARDLAARSEELHSARRLLSAARAREAVDADRHRIARELHDSVTQYVIAAGLAVDVCRTELEGLGAPFTEMSARLASAQNLIQHATGQLRTAIYALSHAGDEAVPALPRMLEQVCLLHARPGLEVELRLEGPPVALGDAAEQSLARVAGEALANVASHSGARRCVVLLKYGPQRVRLVVDDDGAGDPGALRRAHRVAELGDVDGRHRGLVNMASRARELGGTFSIRRSRLGGVRTQVDVPVPVTGQAGPGRGEPS
jgi:signal transduction histidine kinase